MKKPRKETDPSATYHKSTGRFGAVEAMVTEILARIEPGSYAEMVEAFRDEWKPEGVEVRIIEVMAEAACRMRGCAYLETEILNRSMEACTGPGVTPDRALTEAYIRDFDGPQLLDKVSRYRAMLSTMFSRCSRSLMARAENRRRAEERVNATLVRTKPCTSVIQ
jgi:hypothetical protein